MISDQRDLSEVLAELDRDLDRSRIVLESRSKNTYENAVYCAELVKPKPNEHWLLVTGALHMPRAVCSFRMAGFEVEPRARDRGSGHARMARLGRLQTA